jgi:hypothetical protein
MVPPQSQLFSLKGDNPHTRTLLHNPTHPGRLVRGILITRLPRPLLRNLRLTPREQILLLRRKTLLVAVQIRHHRLRNICEGVAFYKHLRAHARIHARHTAVVARAVHVRGAEADRRKAGVHFGEGVVVVCYVQFARVFGGVGVRVADE